MVAGVIVAVVLGILVLMGIFSGNIRSGVYVKALCRAKTTREVVALTFDDGPHPDYTPRILDVLARHGVKTTFFVVGEKAEAHPEIVRRIVAEGHLVGNHTYSHSTRFPWMSERKMKEEIHRCDVVLKKTTGERPVLFRPPFGVTNPTLARSLRRDFTVAGWDVRSFDTMSRWPRTKVFERVLRRIKPGSVVLLHDDRAEGDVLLEMILNHIEQNGYTVERFDKLFGL
jgi:peptidoglycan/xylan/chitin deacetylase (PgdA/CDA1 family)